MAVTLKVYSHFPEHALKELIDLGTPDDIKVALCTSSYTPSQDDHDFYDDITNELSTANGYTSGGAALTSEALTLTARVLKFDADDVQWTSSTITARYAIIYDNTPSNGGNKPLIAYVDFGEDKVSENGTFKIQWHASGILTVTVAA